MAGPQLEDGFSRIANEILEATARHPLSATQHKILLIIWRYTYGFQRKDHELGAAFIAQAADIDKRNVKKELTKMINRNILKVTREATYTTPRRIGFNKRYDEWKTTEKGQGIERTPGDTTITPPGDRAITREGVKLSPGVGIDLSPGEGVKVSPKKDNIKIKKDNIKKDDDGEPPKNQEPETDPFTFYEEQIGFLSPITMDRIGEFIDGQYFDEPEAIINEAITESVKAQASNPLRYLEKVLTNWTRGGIRNREQLQRAREQREHEKHKRGHGQAKRENGAGQTESPDKRAERLRQRNPGII